MFRWDSAPRFPTVIVSAANIQIAPDQSPDRSPRDATITLKKAANAAAFGPADMNPVMAVGAPW